MTWTNGSWRNAAQDYHASRKPGQLRIA
jgi:hypothetical protein